MQCPLCHHRKARRACPALGVQICAVCCGTKRQTEINCPADCVYLASSREHPPAAAVRRHQDDVSTLVRMTRDLNDRQSRMCFLILTLIAKYQPPDLHSLIDEDVADATAALAATYETAARGVIYEHRPGSLAAERFMSALKGPLEEAGRGGGTPFQRDGAVILRRVEEAARDGLTTGSGRRAFVEMIARTIGPSTSEPVDAAAAPEPSRLIIPS